jgi:hypothetical protein
VKFDLAIYLPNTISTIPQTVPNPAYLNLNLDFLLCHHFNILVWLKWIYAWTTKHNISNTVSIRRLIVSCLSYILNYQTSQEIITPNFVVIYLQSFWSLFFNLKISTRGQVDIWDTAYTFMGNWISEISPIAIFLLSLSTWPLFYSFKLKNKGPKDFKGRYFNYLFVWSDN